MSARERLVDAGGVRLRARIDGAGPPVVILHGFTGSGESMAELAAALADGFCAVRIDLLGHGGSDAPADPDAWSFERCLAQLDAALGGLGLRDAHWIGYSMGGRVALGLCALRPERVRSAFLIGASAGIADPAERAARRANDADLARRIEVEGLERFVDAWLALPLFASQGRLAAPIRERARRERLGQRPHGLAASLRGLGSGSQPPLHAHLGRIAAPVALVAGALDAKFAAIAADLARRIPGAELHVVPDAGHAVALESPERVAALARDFLLRAEAGRHAPERGESAPRIANR